MEESRCTLNAMIRIAVLLALASSVAHAQPGATLPPEVEPPPVRTPFDQGRMGLGFGFSAQTNFGADYYVVGGGFGYFVLDGVELGLGAAHQFGDGPSITRTTPSLRYVAQPLVEHSPLVPYIGVFGSRYFIYEGIEDIHTLGARVGAIYVSGSLLIGFGIAMERIVSECNEDCTSFYPDITLNLAL